MPKKNTKLTVKSKNQSYNAPCIENEEDSISVAQSKSPIRWLTCLEKVLINLDPFVCSHKAYIKFEITEPQAAVMP